MLSARCEKLDLYTVAIVGVYIRVNIGEPGCPPYNVYIFLWCGYV